MATNLVYQVANFTPFTKIISADVNSRFQNIKDRFNWDGTTNTGLGDDNIQSNTVSGGGLTRSSKLKAGTPGQLVVNALTTGYMSEVPDGLAGQFLSTGGPGTIPTWVGNPLSAQYNRVVGSAADVTSGAAQYSSIATAITAASNDDRLLILPTYNSTENITLGKRLFIAGLGRGSLVNGTWAFQSGSSGSRMKDLKLSDNVTINSGVDEIYCDIILASTKTFIDNSDISDINYLLAMQED